MAVYWLDLDPILAAEKGLTVAVPEQDVEPIQLSEEKEAPPNYGIMHLFKLPAALWQHLTNSERKSTLAVISGLNISISTYGVRKLPDQGEQATEPVPVSGMNAPSSSQISFIEVGLFSFLDLTRLLWRAIAPWLSFGPSMCKGA